MSASAAPVVYLDCVDSTNSYAIRHCDDLPCGALVVADRQTRGRGRRGRAWHSPAGANFYGSLVCTPGHDGIDPGLVPQLGAVIALACVRQAGVAESWIKWPNDILAGDRKLAGILVEACSRSDGTEVVVLGIGVNLNLSAQALREIPTPATSVAVESGRATPPRAFADELRSAALAWYDRLRDGAGPVLHRAWLDGSSPLIGQGVRLQTPVETVAGTVAALEADGALTLTLADGTSQTFHAGDVSLRPAAVPPSDGGSAVGRGG